MNTWPDLPEPYASALREAVDYITQHYTPLGVIAAGSILRGQGGPSSDLDLYVIHAQPWRQRVQRWFNGVPAEIFVNPPNIIRRYLKDEQREARPITAHMLATGCVLIQRDPVVQALRAQAQTLLVDPPPAAEAELTYDRYMAACLFEDALDVVAADPATADMIMGQAVHVMLHWAIRQAGQFIPRDKDLIATLNARDPALAGLARAYYSAPATERMVLAGQIADQTIQTRGFFAWESEPEPLDQDA